MPFVVDAGVALAWCFADEAPPATEALRSELLDDDLVVPSIWPFEVASALQRAAARGAIRPAEIESLLHDLRALVGEIDAQGADGAWPAVVELGRRFGLSPSQAAYLELARRRDLPLGTLDADLARAARRAGVAVLT